MPTWARLWPRPVQAPRPHKPPHRPHYRRVPRAHPCTLARVAGRSRRKARPQCVTQRAAGQCEAEHVVLEHGVGDEAEAAARVEQAELWRARERMA
jgi:hypothetical protein